MADKPTQSAKTIKEYLSKYPTLPSLTLAKKIFKENKLQFATVESVRTSLRLYRGKSGIKNKRFIKDTSFYNQKIDFKMPESYAETFEPYEIKQSRTLILSDLHFPYQDNKAIQFY